MAKNKRKVTTTTTRGKAILRSSVVDDHDQDRSTVLALQALLVVPPCSSSSVLQPAPPPPACALCLAILPPIVEVAPVPNTLETVTVEDCSADEGLDEALLEEEQLDFSFTNDDAPLLSPPAGLVPPSTSEGHPPSTMDVGGGASPTNVVAGTSLTSTPGSRVWKDFFSASKPTAPCITLKNFSLNHLTKSCAISPEDFQPQFEVWNLCVVGYVSGKNPGTWLSMELSPLFGSVKLHFTIHDSGWLIYRFTREEDKLFVLNGGPYLVYGKPLILRLISKFFYFSSEEMSKVPVWVRFPTSLYVVGLPLACPR
ncbi:hypothetical protein NC653_031983 [Populus alba x Populus x berolinensis]|uniref:DUF4283 domain-containing protein n=1 Tax=Populus alba x Populus x berolinensis TaxID=444605 RepID=A0AAD6LZV0_9ROSI|nr:hypothetical protein NC653_031983 [Populus alba x Populus x berolinensis]